MFIIDAKWRCVTVVSSVGWLSFQLAFGAVMELASYPGHEATMGYVSIYM